MTVEDRIRVGGGGDGIERVEIVLSRQAYSPHRHDTYALGITLAARIGQEAKVVAAGRWVAAKLGLDLFG